MTIYNYPLHKTIRYDLWIDITITDKKKDMYSNRIGIP